MDFVVGGVAGAGATIFTNPMDVVKTRLQLQGELRARAETTKQYKNIFHSIYVIARTEGAPALQKGLMPAVLLGFSMNSIRLGMYHMAEVNGWTKKKNGDISVLLATFWGAAAGYVSGVVTNPIMVVKTRLQALSHPSIAVGRQHKYNGMTDGFIQIYRKEGLKGYFAGINATSLRISIGSATQLTTFSASKQLIHKQGFFQESPYVLAFFASLMSGAATAVIQCPFDVTAVRLYNEGMNVLMKMNNFYYLRAKQWLNSYGLANYSPVLVPLLASIICSVPVVCIEAPLDVVNTRIINQGPASSGARLYGGVFDAMRKIWRTEGLHGLYKGVGPLYWRLAPQTTLSLVIWDVLNDVRKNAPDKNGLIS